MPKPLPLSFYRRDVHTVSRELLGKRLVVPGENGERVSGLIVECEAYAGVGDRASHAYGGRRTARNEAMYAAGGAVYVFFVYGMHYQFNVVTGEAETPHAILLRALQPDEGVDVMRQRRRLEAERELCSGPGKLCQALGIDKRYNHALLKKPELWIETSGVEIKKSEILCGPRIGIDYAGEDKHNAWRYWLKNNPHVSR